MHICTKETFYVDCVEMTIKCCACGEESIHRLGWVAMECGKCKMEFSHDDTLGMIAKRMRNFLKLNRPQMAKITGYSKNTIKKYEFGYCSMNYFKNVQEIYQNSL